MGDTESLSRGLTEENTQLGLISPIGYIKSPIGDFFPNWELGICSLTLFLPQIQKYPITNCVYHPQLGI